MPNKTVVKNANLSAVDILNAIRNSASQEYRSYVPPANPNVGSVREIGNVIMTFPTLQNEFLSNLINRIGRVLITSKMYENPWTAFKRGRLEFGETIEEIFVNIAKPFEYDVPKSENEVFKREIPDVRAAFHVLNYQKFYKATIQQEQLRQAFLSWEGITDLISKIVDSMYSAANYDEFITMKYLLAKHILNGHVYAKNCGAVSAANAKSIVSTIKGVSNDMTFAKTKYNLAGVTNFTMKPDQYLIVNSDFDAIMDVEVLASAFNMDKAEFMGHRVLVDNFGDMDDARLAQLFGSDPNYTALTSAEKTALNAIPAVVVDKDWFMILDNLDNFTEQFNGQGMYWNYWYHVWKTFSISPYHNAVVFVPAAPSITSVTVTPSTATIAAGSNATFAATVVTSNFAPQTVVWSMTSANIDGLEDVAAVSPEGVVSISPELTAGGTITLKATSTFDSTAYGTSTITVPAANANVSNPDQNR